MITDYELILNMLYLGKYEEASCSLHELRVPDQLTDESLLVRKLLSMRLAIKSGNSDLDIESMDTNWTKNPYLKAEVNAVKGLFYFQSNEMQLGQNYFLTAIEQFQSVGHKEKELLCTYNYLIAETHKTSHNIQVLLSQFTALLQLAIDCDNKRTVGVVYRQISYLYKENSDFSEALSPGAKAIEYLKDYGAVCDFQLTVLHMAELYLELHDFKRAQEYLEALSLPFDQRVLFPIYYLKLRMGLIKESSAPEINDLMVQSCPHFIQRYHHWNSNRVQINSKNQIEQNYLDKQAKLNSFARESMPVLPEKNRALKLEARLIQILKQSPHSKILLIEKLWPDFAESEQLNNRFHRLMNRIKKRYGQLVEFKNGFYIFKT